MDNGCKAHSDWDLHRHQRLGTQEGQSYTAAFSFAHESFIPLRVGSELLLAFLSLRRQQAPFLRNDGRRVEADVKADGT